MGYFLFCFCVPVNFLFAAIFKDNEIAANVRFKRTISYSEIYSYSINHGLASFSKRSWKNEQFVLLSI